eukprot:gene1019-47534_t
MVPRLRSLLSSSMVFSVVVWSVAAAPRGGAPPTVVKVPHLIKVPHLTGIFVSLDSTIATRSVAGWVDDLTAMKDVGIEWFCIRATRAV